MFSASVNEFNSTQYMRSLTDLGCSERSAWPGLAGHTVVCQTAALWTDDIPRLARDALHGEPIKQAPILYT